MSRPDSLGPLLPVRTEHWSQGTDWQRVLTADLAAFRERPQVLPSESINAS